MLKMKPPKIIIPIDVVDILGCVYKVHYGTKYIVVMGKSMYRSVDSINQDIERYHKGINENFNKNNLYSKFYQYMVANPKLRISIEMIVSTDNAYLLLKNCQIELDKGLLDPNCLNSKFTPYINKDLQRPANKRKTHWWINRGSYLNFCAWKKKRTTKIYLNGKEKIVPTDAVHFLESQPYNKKK